MNRLETVPNEFFIVVSQWDHDCMSIDPSNPPKGPLVHESFCMTEQEARDRCGRLGTRFGWTAVVRVNPCLPAFMGQVRQRSEAVMHASPEEQRPPC